MKELDLQEPEENPHPPCLTSCSEEEDMVVVDQAVTDSVPAVESAEAPNSFAPNDFVFQAPAGLSSFKFEPLTPHSADAFLTPRFAYFYFLLKTLSLRFLQYTKLKLNKKNPPYFSLQLSLNFQVDNVIY